MSNFWFRFLCLGHVFFLPACNISWRVAVCSRRGQFRLSCIHIIIDIDIGINIHINILYQGAGAPVENEEEDP